MKSAERNALLAKIASLEKECVRLRQAVTESIPISEPCSDEPLDVKELTKDEHFRIYIVWAIGTYPNGVKMLDIRSITTSKRLAMTHSKMIRRDKPAGDLMERVAIEPRVANHLYGEKVREMMVNTGRM